MDGDIKTIFINSFKQFDLLSPGIELKLSSIICSGNEVKIDLSNCQLEDDIIPALTNTITKATNYKYRIDLSNNSLGDSAAEMLSDAINTANSSIIKLDLSNNRITNRGANDLAGALLTCDDPAVVDLHGNKVDESVINVLAQSNGQPGPNTKSALSKSSKVTTISDEPSTLKKDKHKLSDHKSHDNSELDLDELSGDDADNSNISLPSMGSEGPKSKSKPKNDNKIPLPEATIKDTVPLPVEHTPVPPPAATHVPLPPTNKELDEDDEQETASLATSNASPRPSSKVHPQKESPEPPPEKPIVRIKPPDPKPPAKKPKEVPLPPKPQAQNNDNSTFDSKLISILTSANGHPYSKEDINGPNISTNQRTSPFSILRCNQLAVIPSNAPKPKPEDNLDLLEICSKSTLPTDSLLSLMNTSLDSLQLCTLRHITVLNISHNNITQLSNMPQCLRILDASYNAIDRISGLDHCTELEYLNLRRNKIAHTRGLTYNVKLREIYIGRNQIVDVGSIEHLHNVVVFDLGNNNIKSIPKIRTMSLMSNLRHLILFGNPIASLAGYRALVCNLLPNLAILDNTDTPGNGLRLKTTLFQNQTHRVIPISGNNTSLDTTIRTNEVIAPLGGRYSSPTRAARTIQTIQIHNQKRSQTPPATHRRSNNPINLPRPTTPINSRTIQHTDKTTAPLRDVLQNADKSSHVYYKEETLSSLAHKRSPLKETNVEKPRKEWNHSVNYVERNKLNVSDYVEKKKAVKKTTTNQFNSLNDKSNRTIENTTLVDHISYLSSSSASSPEQTRLSSVMLVKEVLAQIRNGLDTLDITLPTQPTANQPPATVSEVPSPRPRTLSQSKRLGRHGQQTDKPIPKPPAQETAIVTDSCPPGSKYMDSLSKYFKKPKPETEDQTPSHIKSPVKASIDPTPKSPPQSDQTPSPSRVIESLNESTVTTTTISTITQSHKTSNTRTSPNPHLVSRPAKKISPTNKTNTPTDVKNERAPNSPSLVDELDKIQLTLDTQTIKHSPIKQRASPSNASTTSDLVASSLTKSSYDELQHILPITTHHDGAPPSPPTSVSTAASETETQVWIRHLIQELWTTQLCIENLCMMIQQGRPSVEVLNYEKVINDGGVLNYETELPSSIRYTCSPDVQIESWPTLQWPQRLGLVMDQISCTKSAIRTLFTLYKQRDNKSMATHIHTALTNLMPKTQTILSHFHHL